MLEGGHYYPTLLTDLREMSRVGAGAIESQAPSLGLCAQSSLASEPATCPAALWGWSQLCSGCGATPPQPTPQQSLPGSGLCFTSMCASCAGRDGYQGEAAGTVNGTLVSWPQPLKRWDASWKLLFPDYSPNVSVFFCSCVFVCLGTA